MSTQDFALCQSNEATLMITFALCQSNEATLMSTFQMRSKLFWDITMCVVVIPCQHFGTTNGANKFDP